MFSNLASLESSSQVDGGGGGGGGGGILSGLGDLKFSPNF